MKIEQIVDIFPNSGPARYNFAAYQKTGSDSITCIIGREVAAAGIEGEPDVGRIKLFELANNSIVTERLIWEPTDDSISLEDPRALELPDEKLVIGLTAVLRDKNGVPIPFPAIVKIDSHSSWNHELPPYIVIDKFGPGKNITPLDHSSFLFRPDDVDYNHKILVFSTENQIPTKQGDIEFPKYLPWANWRIGTTMPPIWINENEALFIFHGISKQQIDGKIKYIYSLGRAKLTRRENSYSVTIAPEAILTPDDFLDSEGQPLVQELHPDLRRVVYSCGGIVKKDQDILSLYVNVGDRTTFEVGFSMAELKKELFKAEPQSS